MKPTEKKQLPSLKHLIKSMQEPKTKDYTFATIFFLIFSIFVFFAIRPSLTTAVSLQKEEAELREVDAKYEQLIEQIVRIQATLETVRDRLFLVDQALPEQPQLNVIMSDIQQSALENDVSIRSIGVQKINLVESEKDVFRSMIISVEMATSFENYLRFENSITDQRRLKKIKKLTVTRPEFGASESGSLKIEAEIEGYYL